MFVTEAEERNYAFWGIFCQERGELGSLRTQTYFRLSLDVIFFGGDKRQPEIRLRSQARELGALDRAC